MLLEQQEEAHRTDLPSFLVMKDYDSVEAEPLYFVLPTRQFVVQVWSMVGE